MNVFLSIFDQLHDRLRESGILCNLIGHSYQIRPGQAEHDLWECPRCEWFVIRLKGVRPGSRELM